MDYRKLFHSVMFAVTSVTALLALVLLLTVNSFWWSLLWLAIGLYEACYASYWFNKD